MTGKVKVVIPPEVLAQMERDIPANELQGVLDEIKRMFENFDPNNPPGVAVHIPDEGEESEH